MQDRLCRYSHVRIIESHDARTVVHWRYAPVSSKNNLWNVDEKTGRGCWVDEYYTIYPDAIGVRKPTWKTGTLGGPRQFQESLPFTNPGQYNSDVVEKDFCTVANMLGEQCTLRFVENPAKTREDLPEELTIQRYNFRSPYDPVIIYEPGNRMHYVRDRDIRGYERGQRAFVLSRVGASAGELKIGVSASERSPVYHPALVILDWGTSGASLAIDGERIPRGPKFRVGHRHRLESSDLVVWIECEAAEPFQITLTPRQAFRDP